MVRGSPDLRKRVAVLIIAGETQRVVDVVEEYPEALELRGFDDETVLHMAAKTGNLELVKYFFSRGVPLNCLDSNEQSALSAAAGYGDIGLVLWMLDHGADVNLSEFPIISAVFEGHLEIVKLLIEHGANYNCIFGADNDRTPLSLALMYNRTEVADYLKSIGAVMPPPRVPQGEDEVRHHELASYLANQTGREPDYLAMQEMIAGAVSVSVHNIVGEKHLILFTSGMSAQPMNVPKEYRELQYAEIVTFLPLDWPIRPPLASPQSWPWRWLRLLAHYPHESNSWFGGPISTFSNSDPPKPLAESCPYDSFLLTYNQHFQPLVTSTGQRINFITAFPLYPEELTMAKKPSVGTAELVCRMEQAGVHPGDKSPRRNVAK